MGSLQGLGLEFQETMSGWLGVGQEDFLAGRITGEREHTPLQFEARIIIDDLEKFIHLAEHEARLTGTVTFAPLGGTFPMEDGVFTLFSVSAAGIRRMTYSFRFTAADGRPYFLFGHKNLKDDPGFDLIEDMTTLYTRIYAGPDDRAPLYGSGLLFFDLKEAPALMASMKVTGAGWWELRKKIQARVAFLNFAWGKLRQEYLRDLNPLYESEYENLVLSGKLELEGQPRDFFLVSGIHDRDFPWGDGEIFWDVLLVLEDGRGGHNRAPERPPGARPPASPPGGPGRGISPPLHHQQASPPGAPKTTPAPGSSAQGAPPGSPAGAAAGTPPSGFKPPASPSETYSRLKAAKEALEYYTSGNGRFVKDRDAQIEKLRREIGFLEGYERKSGASSTPTTAKKPPTAPSPPSGPAPGSSVRQVTPPLKSPPPPVAVPKAGWPPRPAPAACRHPPGSSMSMTKGEGRWGKSPTGGAAPPPTPTGTIRTPASPSGTASGGAAFLPTPIPTSVPPPCCRSRGAPAVPGTGLECGPDSMPGRGSPPRGSPPEPPPPPGTGPQRNSGTRW